jgi:hypothetical protein
MAIGERMTPQGTEFEQRLEELCQKLLRADPDIREIIQYGTDGGYGLPGHGRDTMG